MNRITVDSDLQAKLTQAGDFVLVCDQSGQTIGYFYPGRLKDLSPYSDTEIEQLCQQKTGRPLADIWKDLERQHGA